MNARSTLTAAVTVSSLLPMANHVRNLNCGNNPGSLHKAG